MGELVDIENTEKQEKFVGSAISPATQISKTTGLCLMG